MATVRLSHTLRDTLVTKAAQAYDAAHPLPVLPLDVIRDAAEELHKTPFYQQLESYAMLVESNDTPVRNNGRFSFPLKQVSQVELEYRFEPNDSGTGRIRCTVPSDAVFVSRAFADNWLCNMSIQLQVIDTPETRAIEQLCRDHVAEEKAWQNARTEYVSQVRLLLNSCNTLKQLFEAWPAAESLTPAEVLEKHEAKVERRQSKAEGVEFDLNAADMVVMRAKLKGAL